MSGVGTEFPARWPPRSEGLIACRTTVALPASQVQADATGLPRPVSGRSSSGAKMLLRRPGGEGTDQHETSVGRVTPKLTLISSLISVLTSRHPNRRPSHQNRYQSSRPAHRIRSRRIRSHRREHSPSDRSTQNRMGNHPRNHSHRRATHPRNQSQRQATHHPSPSRDGQSLCHPIPGANPSRRLSSQPPQPTPRQPPPQPPMPPRRHIIPPPPQWPPPPLQPRPTGTTCSVDT